jgi:predicted homoserine dehydrogenase-like protein
VETEKPRSVGIVGTGYIAQGLARALRRSSDFLLGAVLTRRKDSRIPGFHDSEIVLSIDALAERAQIVVECSGDALHATEVIDRVLRAGRPVVTMDAEWHVTAGSYYRSQGFVTEAEGDQPGSLAALAENARAMGFEPLVYVNVKGFLNLEPTPDVMRHFAKVHGITITMVTSFTDGTKLHIEQALVANGLGADMAGPGMLGPVVPSIREGLEILSQAAQANGGPLIDYILTGDAPGAVMILARHDPQEAAALAHLKMGDGPFYRLVQPYHLCQFEILKTLRRVASGGRILLDNGPHPRIGVAAIAKRRIARGERITRGLGSFDARGECVRIADSAGHLPIALMQDVIVQREIGPGQKIMRDDVEMPDSLALRAWLAIEDDALCAARPGGGKQ